MIRQLTEGERRLMTHLLMFGSAGYPIKKVGKRWSWSAEGYDIKGPPVLFKTKREAVASFEAYYDILRELSGQEAFERAFADLVERRMAMGMMTKEEATISAHETVRLLREEEAARAAG